MFGEEGGQNRITLGTEVEEYKEHCPGSQRTWVFFAFLWESSTIHMKDYVVEHSLQLHPILASLFSSTRSCLQRPQC